MKRLVPSTFFVALVLFGSHPLANRAAAALGAAVDDPHAYFNALTARTDFWKGWSLRPVAGQPASSPYYEKQLLRGSLGGYQESSLGNMLEQLAITYAPNADRDPRAQDAAKVTIPAFLNDYGFTVAAPIGAASSGAEEIIRVNGSTSVLVRGRAIKIDGEIMECVNRHGSSIASDDGRSLGSRIACRQPDHTVFVKRGMYGTRADAHDVGKVVGVGGNTVPSTIRLPIASTDGHSYVFTWDTYWTDSYLRSGLTNHKAFQLRSFEAIWWETNAKYADARLNPATDVAWFQVRSYQNPGGDGNWSKTNGRVMGPGTTDKEPVAPQRGEFVIKANTWTRFWIRVEQRANDYDYIDYWVADENHDPVQVYARIPMSAGPTGIDEFIVQFNTSTAEFVRGDQRALVAYVRNIAVFRDVTSPTTLLQRPIGGARLPSPPNNVRIVR